MQHSSSKSNKKGRPDKGYVWRRCPISHYVTSFNVDFFRFKEATLSGSTKLFAILSILLNTEFGTSVGWKMAFYTVIIYPEFDVFYVLTTTVVCFKVCM